MDRAKLAKVCALFSSDKLGERASAAAIADSMVKKAGLSWEIVLSNAPATPKPEPRKRSAPKAPPEPPAPKEFEVVFRGKLVRQTVKAYLSDINGLLMWLPKSEVTVLHRTSNSDVNFYMPRWMAVSKGLI